MTLASLTIQLLNGLASASALFLVAAGLTLIFGVTRIVNFAHGSLYMLGAYLAYSIGAALAALLGSGPFAFWGGALIAALGVAAIGALIEASLLKRLYDAPELLQLTATFGVVLIVRDATLALWGAEDLLGPRAPGLSGTLQILERAVPQYDLFLIFVGPLVLIALTWLITRTRFGVVVRAASENRTLTGALGIDQGKLYTAVFALGAEFVVMAIVLALRPHGLLGRPPAMSPTTPLPEHRAIVVAPTRRDRWVAVAVFVAFALLPFVNDDYALVLAIDVLIATLFAASLQFLTGTGGMTSFGHAAYFGVGSYAAALAIKHGVPFAGALAVGPLAALVAALVFGWFCVRLAGVYLAMLTLAFAQIVWSIAFQWDSVTGGSNGIVGVWPGEWFADRRSFFALTLVTVGAACAAIVAIA